MTLRLQTNHCVGEREGCLGERKRKFVDLRQYGSESVEDDQEHSRHQFKPNFLKFRGCKQVTHCVVELFGVVLTPRAAREREPVFLEVHHAARSREDRGAAVWGRAGEAGRWDDPATS
eukprot:756338-Hanusia_phi.AAC.2